MVNANLLALMQPFNTLTTSSQWQKEHNDDNEDEDTSEEEKKCPNISAGSAQISLKTNYA